MAYQLKSITIRTNNSPQGAKATYELWDDIKIGKLPLLFNSEQEYLQGVTPVAKYHNYESDETGDYDLGIITVKGTFFTDMEKAVNHGIYKKYEAAGEDVLVCTKDAWEMVWKDQKTGSIDRAFTEDFEITVPAEYSEDGKASCLLYIAVKLGYLSESN